MGLSEEDKAVFLSRVERVRNRPCERIAETVLASSNDTPCFLRFCLALFSSHSKPDSWDLQTHAGRCSSPVNPGPRSLIAGTCRRPGTRMAVSPEKFAFRAGLSRGSEGWRANPGRNGQ